jgi:hypothetical protein
VGTLWKAPGTDTGAPIQAWTGAAPEGRTGRSPGPRRADPPLPACDAQRGGPRGHLSCVVSGCQSGIALTVVRRRSAPVR